MGLTAVTPSSGTGYGGTLVTLTGTGFVTGATVTFDGTPATSVVVQPPSGGVHAYAFLASTVNYAAGDTITLGTQVYTYQTTLTNVAGNLLLGGNLSESLNIFCRAVVGGPGRGVTYATATPVHTSAEAYRYFDMAKAVALVAGVAGNSLVSTTTGASAGWITEGAIPTTTLLLGEDAATGGTQIACVTPAHAAGAVDVRVINP
jgi:hypothetical protein